VVVLAANPGHVKRVILVPFEHPRPELAELRIDSRFQQIRAEMWSLIRTPSSVAA
jgi:NitT/TauT family transport system ATP-binding protein